MGINDIVIPKGIGFGEGGGRLGRLAGILTAFKAALVNPAIPEKTIVSPVAAGGGKVAVAAGNAQDGDQIAIGGVTYTWKTTLSTPAEPYEVLIGEDSSAAAGNLKKAINKESTEGTNYGTGTVAHPQVSATVSAGTVTLAAKVKGKAGNSIAVEFTPKDEGTSNVTTTALSGGVDGTVGAKGAVCYSGGKIYVSVGASTVSESNWKSADLA